MEWKWGSGLRRGSAGAKPEPAELSWWGWCSCCAACGRAGEMLAGRRGGEIRFGLAEWKASLPFCLYFFFLNI